jgi:superfamily II DNA or RNA helicase
MPRILPDPDLHASNNWHETRRVFIRENDRVNQSGVKFINSMYNKGISCIYFVGSDVSFGNKIKDMLFDIGVSPRDIKFMTGKESSDTRRKVLNDFKERRIQILGGTTIYDEGVDVPHTGAGVNFGQGFSDINTVQRIGRVLRKIKSEGSIDIDPKDKQIKYYWDPINLGNSITEKHSNFRKNLYEERKEFRVHEREYGSKPKG